MTLTTTALPYLLCVALIVILHQWDRAAGTRPTRRQRRAWKQERLELRTTRNMRRPR